MINLDAVVGATESTTDNVGGGGFLWETNVHEVKITEFYATTAKSGAQAFHIRFENSNGKTYREDMYFISKTGSFTYEIKNKQGKATGKTRHIPGFTACANIVACAFPNNFREFISSNENGATINERYENFFKAACGSCEPGTVPVWDWNKKEDVHIEVDDVMKNIVGKTVKIAIIKKLVNKQKVNDSGVYADVAEYREENEISNAFTMDNFSAAEMLAGKDEPTVHDAWIEANAGKVIDKRKIKDGASDDTFSKQTTTQTKNIFQ